MEILIIYKTMDGREHGKEFIRLECIDGVHWAVRHHVSDINENVEIL